MKKLTLDDLNIAHEKFMLLEPKGGFYDFAKVFIERESIYDKIGGALILIATWNSGRFRFANKSTIINELEEAFMYSQPLFKELGGKRLETANFDEIQEDLKEIYSKFSKIRGVEYTGASKIMSLNNTGMFVMWDKYIRDEHGFGQSADEYARFLKECQCATNEIKWQHDSVSLAKAVDEYNYVNISLPAVQKVSQREKEKQKKKQEEKRRKNENQA